MQLGREQATGFAEDVAADEAKTADRAAGRVAAGAEGSTAAGIAIAPDLEQAAAG